jgi:hypothetical protein
MNIKIERIEINIGFPCIFSDAVDDAIFIAKKNDCKVTFVFNGTYIDVNKNSKRDQVVSQYKLSRVRGCG